MNNKIDVLVSGGGKFLLEVPQQIWKNEDDEDYLPVAIFAGKPLTLVEDGEDGNGGFELMYLDFKSTKFATEEAAKLAAPAFARTVLAHMINLIY